MADSACAPAPAPSGRRLTEFFASYGITPAAGRLLVHKRRHTLPDLVMIGGRWFVTAEDEARWLAENRANSRALAGKAAA